VKAELLQTIIDAAKDAISMIDVEGNVSYMNGAAEEMFGYPQGELMGENLHRMLAPKEYHPAHFEAHKKFQETGEGAAIGATVELTALRKDGSEFPIALSLSSVRIGNRWHAVGVIRDISDRKVAEEEQRRYA
jgi:PAS domain S-box-containing protein